MSDSDKRTPVPSKKTKTKSTVKKTVKPKKVEKSLSELLQDWRKERNPIEKSKKRRLYIDKKSKQ